MTGIREGDPYVFLSYAHADWDGDQRIREIVAGLKRRGCRVWYDQNLTKGESWNDELAAAINSCTAVVVMLTRNSNTSEWVRRELTYASSHKKKIIPVLLEDFALSDGLDLMLGHLQFTDLSRIATPEEKAGKLADGIRDSCPSVFALRAQGEEAAGTTPDGGSRQIHTPRKSGKAAVAPRERHTWSNAFATGVGVCVVLCAVCALAAFAVHCYRNYKEANAPVVALDSEHFPDETFRKLVSMSFDTDGDGILNATEVHNAVTLSLWEGDTDIYRNIGVDATNERDNATPSEDCDADCIGISQAVLRTVATSSVRHMSGSRKLGGSISSTQGIEYLTELRGLNLYNACTDGDSLSIDLSRNSSLIWVDVADNNLGSMGFFNLNHLKLLCVSSNKLSDLDLSTNVNLAYVEANDNQLESLELPRGDPDAAIGWRLNGGNGMTNLSIMDGLHSVQAYNNKLTFLDLSAYNNLFIVDLHSNQLENLRLPGPPTDSKQTGLMYIYLGDNKLQGTVDVSSYDLSELDLSYNDITGITLGSVSGSLSLSHNPLGSIDLSSCPDVTKLYVTDDNLTSLDVSANTKLTELTMAGNNQLTSVDLSNCTEDVKTDRPESVTGLTCTADSDDAYSTCT